LKGDLGQTCPADFCLFNVIKGKAQWQKERLARQYQRPLRKTLLQWSSFLKNVVAANARVRVAAPNNGR
jgi:hypothetical protein